MIRPVCSQLISVLILLVSLLQTANIAPRATRHHAALAQEYSVEQIHIDEQQLYVEGDANGIRVNLYQASKHLSAPTTNGALQSVPHLRQDVQQNQLSQESTNQVHEHSAQYNPYYTLQHQQQEIQNQQVSRDEPHNINHHHSHADELHLLQSSMQHAQHQQQPIEYLTQQHPSQQQHHQHNVHHRHHQPTQEEHQQAQNHLHPDHQHDQQLQQKFLYQQQQQQHHHHIISSSAQIHQQQHIEWRRESTHDGVYSEIYMHNIETTYPISSDPIIQHTGSCISIDDSSILMMHPPSNFGQPTCQAAAMGSNEPVSQNAAGFTQGHHHTNKPSRNSNVESFPLAATHNHYESSLMTAIRHYWREISGLCLASAIFLNWLFVVIKRRLMASGFTRQIDVSAEQVVETIQRYSSSTAANTSLPSTHRSLSKDSATFNNSAHDSAFEETASPIDLDDASSSSRESSLSSRPRSISSSPCDRNLSQPSSSLNSSSYTSDYISRYSSDFDSIRRLGRGGFGIVFEAKNKIDDCHYAVKRICLPLEKEARERVMREVRALAKLDHAGIVRYYNAWLETPPDEWLKHHDAQLGIVHSKDGGLSFPSTDGIYDRNGSELNTREVESGRDINGDKFGESGDLSNDFFGTKSPFKHHRTNGYNNYLKENSNSPSLDIVFEGSGSIRLEAENVTDESSQNDQESSSLPVVTAGLHVEKVYLYIQMQLCRKDTLKDWLKTNCENRDKTTIFDFFYQIVDAVEYVHSQDLIHRDLKPSNIFFSLDGTLKIGDFGLCRAKTNVCVGSSLDLKDYVADYSEAVHTEQVGTQLYMSPEQMNGLSYNHKVDIFAMGLILLELLIPFKTQMQRVNVLLKARNNMFSREFKGDHPDEHELVRSLLDRRPYKRPTATAIKENELLSNAQLSQPVIERIFHRRRTVSSNSSTE